MDEAFVFLRGVSLGLLLAMVLVLLIRYRRLYPAQTLLGFALAVAGYILAPLLYGRSELFRLVAVMADLTPLMFLLFAQAVFAEHGRPAPLSLFAALAYLASGYGAAALRELGAGPEVLPTGLWLGSRAIQASMLAYAVFLVVRHWREDLVEPRRALRLTVTLISGAYVLGVVIVETLVGSMAIPLWAEVLHSGGIVVSTALFTSVLLLLGPQELARVAQLPSPTAPAPDRAVQQELERIVQAMQGEQRYRDMELTIGSLSEALAIPEHRLRRHINRLLGYRNFSDFLNSYRIAETAARLRDPGEARVPVLTIAMDAGYRSMTTFNKAFKATHGLTPKEYRQQQLQAGD